MRIKKKKKYKEIAPDEVFPDSYNFPGFDKSQYEGRLEKPITKKTAKFIGVFFILIFGIIFYKTWDLQILKGEAYEIRANQNNLKQSTIFADRGVIFDRNNIRLAWNENNENEDFSKRVYSDKKGNSHIVGYIGYPLKDSNGFYYREEFVGMGGIEKFMNSIIKGENGINLSEVDVFSKTISESSSKKPKNGEDVILTIDSKMQEKLFDLIEEVSKNQGFSGGAGILMNINNGDIIISTSYPEYDSQIMSDGKNKKLINSFFSNENNPFLNRVTHGLYTPGSIIKPFLAIGALEEGIVTEEEEIVSNGEIKIQNPYNPELFSTFYDWKAHGPVDIKKAISVSSNIYFYVIGGGFEEKIGIGISGIEKYADVFGIGKNTGVKWLSETEGVIPNPEWKSENFDGDEWRVGDTYNTSIGQYGFQVTPIQMVKAVSALANNGYLIKPRIVVSEKIEKNEVPEVVENKYYKIVKEGMRDAVVHGTAKALSVPFLEIGAKTGTAQIGTLKKKVNSWVIGFFPYENPKYAFSIVMERGPEDNLIGAPYVARKFFEWLNINDSEYIK